MFLNESLPKTKDSLNYPNFYFKIKNIEVLVEIEIVAFALIKSAISAVFGIKVFPNNIYFIRFFIKIITYLFTIKFSILKINKSTLRKFNLYTSDISLLGSLAKLF